MNPPLPRHPRLDEMLSLYDQGLSYRQIGEQLGISHETARKYIGRHKDVSPQPPPVDDDGSCWMTVPEAAKALGVITETVHNRIQRGVIEVRRVERYCYVRVWDHQWADSEGVKPHVRRILDLRSEGWTQAAIGRELGIAITTVQWHLKQRGGEVRDRRCSVASQVDRIIELRAQGWSYQTIGAEMGVSGMTVWRLLRRRGLQVSGTAEMIPEAQEQTL